MKNGDLIKKTTGFDSAKRYDETGRLHKNPFTGENLMQHAHDRTVSGGVGSPIPWEMPRKQLWTIIEYSRKLMNK